MEKIAHVGRQNNGLSGGGVTGASPVFSDPDRYPGIVRVARQCKVELAD